MDSNQTDLELLERLGRALAAVRLQRNETQADLAKSAGVSRATVQRLESGSSTQLTNLVRVLRALELQQNLDALVPAVGIRPIEELELAEVRRRNRRRRASGRRTVDPKDTTPGGDSKPWRWGEDS